MTRREDEWETRSDAMTGGPGDADTEPAPGDHEQQWQTVKPDWEGR